MTFHLSQDFRFRLPAIINHTVAPVFAPPVGPSSAGPPALAADGRTIYYWSQDPAAKQTTRVLRRDLTGGPENEVWIDGISVSPDGSRLAFTGGTPSSRGHWALMTVAAAGGQPSQVFESPVWIHSLLWSKDGSRLFFVDPFPASRDIMSIPAEGGEPQPLGTSPHEIFFLAMHPDGRQIVFTDYEEKYPLCTAVLSVGGAARNDCTKRSVS